MFIVPQWRNIEPLVKVRVAMLRLKWRKIESMNSENKISLVKWKN